VPLRLPHFILNFGETIPLIIDDLSARTLNPKGADAENTLGLFPDYGVGLMNNTMRLPRSPVKFKQYHDF
jgi:hypothetical protein